MLRVLFATVRILAKTILGLFAIVLCVWYLVLGIIWVSHSTPTSQFFALGVLTVIILCLSHQLGGVLWRLLD